MTEHSTEHYVLVDGEPVLEPDQAKWMEWHCGRPNERVVEKTWIGEVEISTVFVDRQETWRPRPFLFYETLVFGGPLDHDEEQYYTRAEALEGHRQMVKRVRVAAGQQKNTPAQ